MECLLPPTVTNASRNALQGREADGTIWEQPDDERHGQRRFPHWRIQRCAVEWEVFAGAHGMAIIPDTGQDLWTLWHDLAAQRR